MFSGGFYVIINAIMKKNVPAVFAAMLALTVLSGSCGGRETGAVPGAVDALSSAIRDENLLRELQKKYLGNAAADGMVKTAIIRNLSVGDHTRQFLEGCVSEGRSMGFVVDTFVTGGDDERCRELIAQIAGADYDGIILSNGGAATAYDALKPAADRGIRVVTFDALPYKDGDPRSGVLPGVTATFQDDEKLAEISLGALLERFPRRPVRVIRVWYGPGIPPLDRRKAVFDAYVRAGKIEECAVVSPRDFVYARNGVTEALPAVLSRFPPGTADALWAPYDEFAKGCADVLYNERRRDIQLFSIDISNDDIKMMLDHGDIWRGAAAADPALIGTVNMRLLAAKFAGESTPDTYNFDAVMVETEGLDRSVTMENIARAVPGWPSPAGLFDGYPWMAELKAAGRYFTGAVPAARARARARTRDGKRNAE
jgi:simple sugar transport system substrate-binding protein